MGDIPRGGVATRVIGHNLIESTGTGFITQAHALECRRDTEAIFAQHPGPFALLADSTDVEAFEPGMPAIALRSLLLHRDRYTRIAFVARRPLLLGVVNVLTRLLVGVPTSVHPTREEALLALAPPTPRPSRTATPRPSRTSTPRTDPTQSTRASVPPPR